MLNSLGWKVCLRLVGVLGAAIFSAFFALTYNVPGWVETHAADFIEGQVAEEANSRIDSFEVKAGDSAVSQLAATMYRQNEREIGRLKEALKAGVHEKMAGALAQIRDLDCKCRDRYSQLFQSGFEFDMALLRGANERIVEFIQATYMRVSSELKRDIRIFTGSSAAVFLLLLVVSFLKPRAIAHLFLPGLLLTGATLISAYFYIFEQNWLLTIIYGDYIGYAYLAFLAVVFLVLCDIVINRARVTTRIVNGVLDAAGSVIALAPC